MESGIFNIQLLNKGGCMHCISTRSIETIRQVKYCVYVLYIHIVFQHGVPSFAPAHQFKQLPSGSIACLQFNPQGSGGLLCHLDLAFGWNDRPSLGCHVIATCIIQEAITIVRIRKGIYRRFDWGWFRRIVLCFNEDSFLLHAIPLFSLFNSQVLRSLRIYIKYRHFHAEIAMPEHRSPSHLLYYGWGPLPMPYRFGLPQPSIPAWLIVAESDVWWARVGCGGRLEWIWACIPNSFGVQRFRGGEMCQTAE